MGSLPESSRRLFAGYDERALHSPAGRGLLIARLLEDGEGPEVAWLLAHFGEGAVSDWVAAHGHRQLSHRSRTFWAWVLDCPLPAPPAAAEALWPL